MAGRRYFGGLEEDQEGDRDGLDAARPSEAHQEGEYQRRQRWRGYCAQCDATCIGYTSDALALTLEQYAVTDTGWNSVTCTDEPQRHLCPDSRVSTFVSPCQSRPSIQFATF